MRTLLAALFRLWRATLGAVLPDSCRFTPTCSRYAEEAFLRHSPPVAAAKTIWRLLRCQPFSKGGYDPVIASRPPCRPAVPVRRPRSNTRTSSGPSTRSDR